MSMALQGIYIVPSMAIVYNVKLLLIGLMAIRAYAMYLENKFMRRMIFTLWLVCRLSKDDALGHEY